MIKCHYTCSLEVYCLVFFFPPFKKKSNERVSLSSLSFVRTTFFLYFFFLMVDGITNSKAAKTLFDSFY